MSPVFFSAVILLAVLQFTLPRRLAYLPLLAAALHLGMHKVVGDFGACRIVIIAGLIRAAVGGHLRPANPSHLDKVVLVFGGLIMASTLGNAPSEDFGNPLLYRAGITLNALGSYFYGRAYLQRREDFVSLCSSTCLLILPLAIGLVGEKLLERNLYAPLGALTDGITIRNGSIRATGPFLHAILTGTAGAAAIPLCAFTFIEGRRVRGAIGIASAATVIICSASSGPMGCGFISLVAFYFWRHRAQLRPFLLGLTAVVLLWSVIKMQGPWFILARIDLVGGSTGWHRAELFDQAVKHVHEWWLAGTTVTRHWMPTGVSWSANHTDLTNYYVHLGVICGLPTVLLLLYAIRTAFRRLSDILAQARETPNPSTALLAWCSGTALTIHAVSFFSISYFDQMFVFFYVLLATIAGLQAPEVTDPALDPTERGEHAVA